MKSLKTKPFDESDKDFQENDDHFDEEALPPPPPLRALLGESSPGRSGLKVNRLEAEEAK